MADVSRLGDLREWVLEVVERDGPISSKALRKLAADSADRARWRLISAGRIQPDEALMLRTTRLDLQARVVDALKAGMDSPKAIAEFLAVGLNDVQDALWGLNSRGQVRLEPGSRWTLVRSQKKPQTQRGVVARCIHGVLHEERCEVCDSEPDTQTGGGQ